MLRLFQQREKLVKYFLGAILVVVSVGMTMYLIPGFLYNPGGNQSNGSVASVNGQPISVLEFSQAYQQRQQQYASQLPASMMPLLGRQVLQGLIQTELMVQQAKELGLTVSNAELSHYLQQDPNLFPNGQFIGAQQYQNLIANSYNMTVPEFEAQQRDRILEGKLLDLITDGVRVSPQEVRQEFLQEFEKAKIAYVALAPQSLKNQVKPTPAALEAYYHAHASSYMTPEKRRLQFVVAEPALFAAQVKVSDAAIARVYQQNLGQYTYPERAKVAHILIKTTGDNAAQRQAALKKAQSILAQLRHGADFAKLAKQYSQDPGSAAQGGELGWITPGQTVPAFQQTAFSLPVGQISGIVKTVYGYHIIKVEARQPAHTESLAEATPQIRANLQQTEAQQAAQNAIQQAATMAPTSGLAAAANSLHLPLITTPPISRTDPVEYVGVNPDFVNAVFQAPANGLTPVLNLPSGFVLAQVKAILPPQLPPFSQVAAEVQRDYIREQAQKLMEQQAQKLAQTAKQSGVKGLQAAAAKLGMKLATSGWLGRNDELTGIGPVSSFFRPLVNLQPGQAGGPVLIGTDQVVYVLQQLQPPPSGTFAKNRLQIKNTLLEQKREHLFTAYSDALLTQAEKTGKVKINEAQLENVLGTNSD